MNILKQMCQIKENPAAYTNINFVYENELFADPSYAEYRIKSSK